MHDFVVGVDIDGVIADYVGALRVAVATIRGIPVSELPYPRTYAMDEWEWSSRADLRAVHRHAVRSMRIFRDADPIPGAQAGIQALAEAGLRCIAVTHRANASGLGYESAAEIPDAKRSAAAEAYSALAVHDTRRWIDVHGFQLAEVCFLDGPKHVLDADVFIDDSPNNVASLADAGKRVLCYDQPYNRVPLPHGVCRVNDWDEAAATILRMHDEEALRTERLSA